MSSDTEILLWVIGGGFTLVFIILKLLWNRIDKIDQHYIELKIDLTEIKTMLKCKESCMIKDESQMRKAE
jgi:hypothetical protein